MNEQTKTTSKKKKQAVITIKGTQNCMGDNDEVELTTVGDFYKKDESYVIKYRETEVTGFDGCTTTLEYHIPSSRVTMSRIGPMNSILIVEQGKRNQCNYETPAGPMMIGIFGKEVSADLSGKGGHLRFGYSLDINAALTSENTVDVTIKN